MKNKTVLWIVIALVAVVCCCCTTLTVLFVSSPDFKESFVEGYCESWAEQGRSPSEDPFKLCY
jgi:hypothetical protein